MVTESSNKQGVLSSTLFSLDDSSSNDIASFAQAGADEDDPTILNSKLNSSNRNKDRSAYGLASTQSSREAQFDLDDDSLGSEDEERYLTSSNSNPPNRPRTDSTNRISSFGIPLADRIPVGRPSLDGIGRNLRQAASQAVPGWDGEGLPDWLKRGGSIFEGTVNMANSILGAGIVGEFEMRRGERQCQSLKQQRRRPLRQGTALP